VANEVLEIEKNKEDFSTDLFFEIRAKTREVLHLISDRIHVGMLEEEANELAKSTLQEMGTSQGWHPPYVRFGSFMPKPFANRTGSGAHYNMSLADRLAGEKLFFSADDPRDRSLSQLGYQFISGILRHASAICAAITPTVNSYKGLVARGSMSGFTWAPVYICYGNNNRTNMLRIPASGGRVECRAADISTNLYLGAAMILAAGLEGIREGLDPGGIRVGYSLHSSISERYELEPDFLFKVLLCYCKVVW